MFTFKKAFSIIVGAVAVCAANPQSSIGDGSPKGDDASIQRNFMGHPWAMRRANAQRTGQSPFNGAEKGRVAWQWMTKGSVPSIAVGSSGQIYLGVTFHRPWWSSECYLTVLDPEGEVAWRHRVTPFDWGASQGVNSGPAIDSMNNVVLNSANGQLLKYSAFGSLLWTVTRRTTSSNDSAPAVDSSNNVFQYHAFDGGLAKYTPSGDLIWRSGTSSETDVAIAPNGDLVIGGLHTRQPHGSTNITYFNPNGTIRWRRFSSNGIGSQAMVGPDGTVYQGGGAYFPADGSIKWGSPNGADGALGKNGQYYVSTGAPSVTAYNAQTGQVLWTKSVVGRVMEGMAIDSRDVLYVTTDQGYIFSFSPTDGNLMLQMRICDEFKSGPVIGGNGNVLASGVRNGFEYVYSIF